VTNDKRTRRWILMAGLALFALFIIGGALAPAQKDRITYSALQMGLALICFAVVAWLAGMEIAARDSFTWRGTEYRGPTVRMFGRAWKAFGVAYGLLGVFVIVVWIMRRG
jgi:hypothetical protein